MFNESLIVNKMNSACCRISYCLTKDFQIGMFISHNTVPYLTFTWFEDTDEPHYGSIISCNTNYSTAVALDIGRYSFSDIDALANLVGIDSVSRFIKGIAGYFNYNDSKERCNLVFLHKGKVRVAPYEKQYALDLENIKHIILTGDRSVEVIRAEIVRFSKDRKDKGDSIV